MSNAFRMLARYEKNTLPSLIQVFSQFLKAYTATNCIIYRRLDETVLYNTILFSKLNDAVGERSVLKVLLLLGCFQKCF